MKISESILNNEALAKEMRIFLNEIQRLKKLKALFQLHNLFYLQEHSEIGPINESLIQALNRSIRSAKDRFQLINETYCEIDGEKAKQATAGLLNEIKEEMQEIDNLLMRIVVRPR